MVTQESTSGHLQLQLMMLTIFLCTHVFVATRAGLWAIVIRPFVGNDYSCDTSNHGTSWINGHFYGDDPLWDGAGCGVTGTCCSFNTPPWFMKQLPSSTDPIELHNCGDQGLGDENIGVKLLEVYVQ